MDFYPPYCFFRVHEVMRQSCITKGVFGLAYFTSLYSWAYEQVTFFWRGLWGWFVEVDNTFLASWWGELLMLAVMTGISVLALVLCFH